MSKVSVIIPVYNVEAYLPKCIESVQNQTEKDIEIILVDDGSTDSCGAICDRYAKEDERISVLHQENGGLSAARNAGIRVASADYLLFIDSDDYVDSDLVERAFSAALENGADIVAYGYQKVTENGDVSFVYDLPADLPSVAFSLAEVPSALLMAPSACNKLFRKSLFENLGFPPRVWYEDLRTVPKLYPQVSKIVCLHGFYPYKYLARQNSIMTSGNIERTKTDRIAAVDSVLSFYKEAGLYEKYKPQLEWLYFFHGYFLPCREIMNFSGDSKTAMQALKANLAEKIRGFIPQNSPYFATLSKREKLIFALTYNEHYFTLKLFVKINQKLKK